MDAPLVARGLTAGVVATMMMTLIELGARSLWGPEVLLDWRLNQATAARILKRPAEGLAVAGLGFHFLHGLLAGLAFVLVVPIFPPALPTWILGLGYGVVLFAITLVLHRTVTKRASPPWDLGSAALAVGIVSHLVYGAALAALIMWP